MLTIPPYKNCRNGSEIRSTCRFWGLLMIRTKSYAKDSKSFLDKSLQEPPDSGVRLEHTLTTRQEIGSNRVRIESNIKFIDTIGQE